ncbi:hypothetical protein J2X09_003273 [Hydrogenophaga laconesensis]|uniref:Uncharacterized protein n=1 Tax=Hydrogenophaga laconesensis TaxID=1805971 RepID=A0ABU1VDG1_9BURK|nr:hypothetical protein [Hydrogenophaga laconesensis]
MRFIGIVFVVFALVMFPFFTYQAFADFLRIDWAELSR